MGRSRQPCLVEGQLRQQVVVSRWLALMDPGRVEVRASEQVGEIDLVRSEIEDDEVAVVVLCVGRGDVVGCVVEQARREC